MTDRRIPRVPSSSRPPWRDDDGQIMLMAIGYAIVALLLVTAVVSASGIHLERKRLLALADLAALAAADCIDRDAYFTRDPDADLVRLGDDEVRAEVVDYLAAAAPAADLERRRARLGRHRRPHRDGHPALGRPARAGLLGHRPLVRRHRARRHRHRPRRLTRRPRPQPSPTCPAAPRPSTIPTISAASSAGLVSWGQWPVGRSMIERSFMRASSRM